MNNSFFMDDPFRPYPYTGPYFNDKQGSRVWQSYIIRKINHSLDTETAKVEEVASIIEEVTITCSDKLNKNGAKTMVKGKEIATNVKEVGEVYIPIVKNRSLNMEVGANYSDV